MQNTKHDSIKENNEDVLEKVTSSMLVELNEENAHFCEKYGFLSMTLKTDKEEKTYDRVFLHRAFPFEMPWQYISVLDTDGAEIGIIYDLKVFEKTSLELLKTELDRKYYEPKIESIISQKERYGFSYWQVVLCDKRKVKFTMQDTFRNIIRAGEDKMILSDVDGNRFVIESIAKLDKKSRKKIELFI